MVFAWENVESSSEVSSSVSHVTNTAAGSSSSIQRCVNPVCLVHPSTNRYVLFMIWYNLLTDFLFRAGQVFCFESAVNVHNILPGSRAVIISTLDGVRRDLVKAVALLEGALPVSHLKPSFHHFVHYADTSISFGNPVILWMMAFERCVLFAL